MGLPALGWHPIGLGRRDELVVETGICHKSDKLLRRTPAKLPTNKQLPLTIKGLHPSQGTPNLGGCER